MRSASWAVKLALQVVRLEVMIFLAEPGTGSFWASRWMLIQAKVTMATKMIWARAKNIPPIWRETTIREGLLEVLSAISGSAYVLMGTRAGVHAGVGQGSPC